MRLLICAGGTGGGVYPALSVLQHLMRVDHPGVESNEAGISQAGAGGSQPSSFQTLWVGSLGGMEADLVKREGIRFEAIPAAGLHGVGWRALPGNLWQLGRGFVAALQVLRRFRPQVLLFTGGFVAVPMALAAKLSGKTKSLLYVPDIEPGLALKTIARFADQVAVTGEETKAYLPKSSSVSVTGYPLRPTLETWSRAEARSVFALSDDLPLLLVFGGSKGARSINRALLAALPELLKEMQVLHICGQLDWQEVAGARSHLMAQQAARYRVYPYLYKEMGAALRAADLAVTRAGASTLGELPLFGLPAILVPYPYAWRYQRVNAQYLVERGAAEMVEDNELPEKLESSVRALMADGERRERMRRVLQSLARPQAAAEIAKLLTNLAGTANRQRA